MTASLLQEIRELPLERRHPDGIWRVPLEMVLASSSSGLVDKIRARQASGRHPFTDCAVWIQRGRFWAQVFWASGKDGGEGGGEYQRLSMVFALDLWPWESREVRSEFGLRRSQP